MHKRLGVQEITFDSLTYIGCNPSCFSNVVCDYFDVCGCAKCATVILEMDKNSLILLKLANCCTTGSLKYYSSLPALKFGSNLLRNLDYTMKLGQLLATK